jgi:dihydrofolate reductase
MSLDGFIADENGQVDWLPQPQADGQDFGISAFFHSVDGLLMGSSTYLQMYHWHENGQFSYPYVDKTNFVFTSNPDIQPPTGISSVEFIRQNAEDFTKDLIRSQRYKHLCVFGGGKLIASLHQAEVITDWQLAIVPIILGKGIPLFRPPLNRQSLELYQCQFFKEGLIMLHYKNASAKDILY